MSEQHQRCLKCGNEYPLNREYFGHRSQTGKFRTTCRTCESQRVLKYKRENRQADNQRTKQRVEKLNGWKPTLELKSRLFQEQNGICALCGGVFSQLRAAQIEHLLPVSQGGSNEDDNLVVAHSKCNQEKHGKSFAQYVAWRQSVGLPRSTFCNEKIVAAMMI